MGNWFTHLFDRKFKSYADVQNQSKDWISAERRLKKYDSEKEERNNDWIRYQGYKAFAGGGTDLKKTGLDKAAEYAANQELLTGKWTTKGFKFNDEEKASGQDFTQGKKYSQKQRDKAFKHQIEMQKQSRKSQIMRAGLNSKMGTSMYDLAMSKLGKHVVNNSINKIDTYDAMAAVGSGQITNDKAYQSFYDDYGDVMSGGIGRDNNRLEDDYIANKEQHNKDISDYNEALAEGGDKDYADAELKRVNHKNDIYNNGLLKLMSKYKYNSPEAKNNMSLKNRNRGIDRDLANYNVAEGAKETEIWQKYHPSAD